MKWHLTFCSILFTRFLFSQTTAPNILWEHSYGGSQEDISYSVKQTSDGGFVVAGSSASGDGDILRTAETQHGGDYDFWITKTDAASNIQWKKHLGGTGNDALRAIVIASDGSYFAGGSTESNDVDVWGNHGIYDFWLTRLDGSGGLQWQMCFGGSNYDNFRSMSGMSDGGLVMCGSTSSNNGDVAGNHGLSDCWILKIEADANIQWQKCLGGTSIDLANKIIPTLDGGYIVVGNTQSNNGDVSGNHGNFDAWIVKLDNGGQLVWQKCFGGSNFDEFTDVREEEDGSLVVCGNTKSTDGDVSGVHGDQDQWLIKTDASGNLLWQHCYGGSGLDAALAFTHNYYKGWVLAGYTNSLDGDVSFLHGDYDDWLVSTDSAGNLSWEKTFGGTLKDVCYDIQNTSDEGFVLTGYSESTDGDASSNHGKEDYWVLRMEGLLSSTDIIFEDDVLLYPTLASNDLTVFVNQPGSFHLQIINTLGQVLYESDLTSPKEDNIDISHLASGNYFICIRSKYHYFNKKFFKI